MHSIGTELNFPISIRSTKEKIITATNLQNSYCEPKWNQHPAKWWNPLESCLPIELHLHFPRWSVRFPLASRPSASPCWMQFYFTLEWFRIRISAALRSHLFTHLHTIRTENRHWCIAIVPSAYRFRIGRMATSCLRCWWRAQSLTFISLSIWEPSACCIRVVLLTLASGNHLLRSILLDWVWFPRGLRTISVCDGCKIVYLWCWLGFYGLNLLVPGWSDNVYSNDCSITFAFGMHGRIRVLLT